MTGSDDRTRAIATIRLHAGPYFYLLEDIERSAEIRSRAIRSAKWMANPVNGGSAAAVTAVEEACSILNGGG